MLDVGSFYDALDSFAPFSDAESWDNVGLLIGGRSQPVKRVLLALDLTGAVLDEAKQLGAELVITHHPVIFSPLKSLDSAGIPYRAAAAGLSVICAHTNLDVAEGGVNDALAERLALENIRPLGPVSSRLYKNPTTDKLCSREFSLGRVGELARPMPSSELAAMVKDRLGAAGARRLDSGCEISTVAVCGGSGGELLRDAKMRGAQALVTGEVKHNHILEAAELGLSVIEAGHFATENVVITPLKAMLERMLPGAEILVSQDRSADLLFS